MPTQTKEASLLRIEDLTLHFRTANGMVQAVDGIDFDLDYNQAVVVGSSTRISLTCFPEDKASDNLA